MISGLLLFALSPLLGCTSLSDLKSVGKNRSVVQVESKRNTARANELTHAGIRALNKRQIDLAARKFREAVEADYAYGPAHNNLGLMHYEQGNLYQAVMAFEQAREFLPSDPAVAYNLGLALESAGRTDEALELYYTANAMDRANPNYLGNLVRLRVRLGERDELLDQQLQDLALIETRPDWRRWTDIQLALNMNPALDRGPATPDIESTVNDASEPSREDLQHKIIDLTPVMPASLELPVEGDVPKKDLRETESPGRNGDGETKDSNAGRTDEPAMDLLPPKRERPGDLGELLEEGGIEDLTEQDYYQR